MIPEDWKPCFYENCWHPLPAPYSPELEIYIHPDCESHWWDATGPYPRPATITMRGGLVKVLGEPTESAKIIDDDDPELLRSRGVFT